MVSDGIAIRPALSRDEVGTLLGQTMGLVAVTAGVFSLGAYLGRDIAYQWGWVFFIGAFLLLIGVNLAAQRSEQAAITLLFGFGLLIGLATAPTVAYYASADPQAVWEAGGATALFVAGFTMFDFQRLRKTKDIRAAPLLAASIFLDVLNVFLFFLSIFGRR